MYDLIIRNVKAADGVSGVTDNTDIAVENGLIVRVEPGIDAAARETMNAEGLIAVPGIIDTHLHLTPHAYGERMTAAAGVTTCIDMAGPASRVLDNKAKEGCGLTVAVLSAILPEKLPGGNNPSTSEIEAFIDLSLADGAYGVKLLGGHFPLTPEASGRMVEASARRGVYMAWHAGSTTAGSDIVGMSEAVEMADGHPFHLCHINGYCRGRVKSVASECDEAAALLEAHPEIVTESYLSARSAAPLAADENGNPKSRVVQTNLRRSGYEPTRDGLIQATLDGVLSVILPENGMLKLVSGREGADALLDGRAADGSFDRVNPVASRVFLATAKRADGTFLVDGIATDGGAIPRNVIVEGSFPLMDLGGLSLTEFAAKTSLLPARMLGLSKKGRLAPGFDADITLISPVQRRAHSTFVQGRPVLQAGSVIGTGGAVLCAAQGAAAVRARGLTALPVAAGVPTLDRRFGHLC